MGKISKEPKKCLFGALYLIILIVSLMPIFCNYLMDGGSMGAWLEWLAASNVDLIEWAVLIWQIVQLILQVGTLAGVTLLLSCIFKREVCSVPVLIGTALYMSNPYRLYVCYDLVDLGQALFLMLMPLLLWIIWSSSRKENKAVAVFSILGVAVFGTVGILLVDKSSQIMSTVGINRYVRYELGTFLSCYCTVDGRPGMGVGLLVVILAGGWLWTTQRVRINKKSIVFIVLSIMLAGGTFISGEPLFWGCAQLLLCILGAEIIDTCLKQSEEILRKGVPLVVLLSCVGMIIYQCNELIYYRIPIEITLFTNVG